MFEKAYLFVRELLDKTNDLIDRLGVPSASLAYVSIMLGVLALFVHSWLN